MGIETDIVYCEDKTNIAYVWVAKEYRVFTKRKERKEKEAKPKEKKKRKGENTTTLWESEK